MPDSPITPVPLRCPGQAYSISQAVCRARQGANFFLCPVCDSRDQQERAPSTRDARAGKSNAVDRIFRAYDVCGVYPETLNEEAAWKVGHAAANFLRSLVTGYARSERHACSIVVGRDTRPSGIHLQRALIEGISSTDTDAIDLGVVDGPMLCFAVNHLGACGGVHVTASHRPSQHNGLRILGQGGKPVIQDTGLLEVKRIAEAISAHKTAGVRWIDRNLWPEYRAFVRRFLDADLRPLKVVVDASNGAAGTMIPAVFDDLPVRIVPLNFEPVAPFAHEPNPLMESSLSQLKAAVVAEDADFGVCFDSDCDRVAFVDEAGAAIRSDLVLALLAPALLAGDPGAAVVFDVRSSRVVAEETLAAGGVPRRDRVAHTFLRKALAESKGVLAGGGSGHFFFKDNWYGDSGALALAHMLNVVSRRGERLSQLVRPLQRYAVSGELSFRNDRRDETIAALHSEFAGRGKIDTQDGLRVDFDDWWFSVRKANTEPVLRLNVEAIAPTLLAEKLADLSTRLGQ
ncbi:MAG: phosphomannomutase/phosphoglucomutase [Phycisphaerae bacterium]|nr:phosphomannomutase/phosphoglucomutase [Phycisphaerae bacterium]